MRNKRHILIMLPLWVLLEIFLTIGMGNGLSVGLFPQSGQQKIEFTAEVNADKIGIDDTLVYNLTIKGENNPVSPTLPRLKGFQVVQNQRSSSFSLDNGVYSYSTTFTYFLKAQTTGKIVIEPASVILRGQTFKTQPIQITVVKGSILPQQSPQNRRRSPFGGDLDDFFNDSPFQRNRQMQIDVHLKAKINKTNAEVGEQLIYRVLLYTRNNIQGVQMLSKQSIPGFWQEWYPIPRSITPEYEMVNGKRYHVYEISKVFLFPNKAGAVTIPELKYELAVLDGASSFFATTRRLQRETQPVSLNVASLPAKAVGLPVGRFEFSVSVDKREMDVNDILTVTIKVNSSKGNIKTLQLPVLPSSDDFKVFPAKTSNKSEFVDNALLGIAEAEIPVAFKTPGQMTIPPLTFQYYDPDASQLKTLTSKAVPINVVGTKEKQETVSTIPKTDIVIKGEDIDFIKKGDIYDQTRLFYKTRWFSLLLLLIFGMNLLFLLKIWIYDRLISGSAILAKKKRLNNTINRLKKVTELGEISPILEEYLTAKTKLGLSELNNISISALLSEHNISDVDIKTFLKIKNESEHSRFAPAGMAGANGAAELSRNIAGLIEILKRMDGRLK